MDDLQALLDRHEREKFAFDKFSDAEKARYQLAMRMTYATDPWRFLTDCVYTLDQVDPIHPVKPFPAHWKYLEFFARIWTKYKCIAVPKSRRMSMSWTCISLYLQDTILNPGRFNGFVSKKEDDAADLVERAEFIYRHIPEWRIPRALLPKLRNDRMSKQPPTLDFLDVNSKIQGFPMGADQLRQFTLSGLLGDECAFWEEAHKFYSGSKPTIDGGGRMTLISSRSPGFFKKIVFDQLDAIDLNFPEIPPVPPKYPMQGIEIWQNPKNKFLIFDCHYTANEGKRSPEWRDAIKQSMPARDFAMEYEKSWHTYEGLPVYADFSKQLHVSTTDLKPEPGLPLLLGWDFGLTPACILAQLQETRLIIFKEYIGTNIGITRFSEQVYNYIKTRYTTWTYNEDSILSFIDPAGFQRNQVDERTCSQALRDQGFKRIEPGPLDFESRKQAVEHFLVRQTQGMPCLLLDHRNTPTLIDGFAGGYRFNDSELERQSNKLRPIKDRYSHPHDALQYLAGGAKQKLKTYNLTIPSPQYGFTKRSS